MLESKIQAKVIKEYEVRGYYVIKLIKTNKNGIPDLLCIKKNDIIFVEVKGANGRLSQLQKYRIKELKDIGIKCIINMNEKK